MKPRAFKRSFSAQHGRQDMSDDNILQRIDDKYQAEKSKVLAERSRHFLSG